MGSRKDVSVVNQGTTTKLTTAVEESNDPGPFVQFCIVTTNNTFLILIRAFICLKSFQFCVDVYVYSLDTKQSAPM